MLASYIESSDVLHASLLSLGVSSSATILAMMIGVPIGLLLYSSPPKLRATLTSVSRALMATPPVIVGLVVYLSASTNGFLNGIVSLYSPKAMILAQFLLLLPISISVSESLYQQFYSHFELMLYTRSISLLDSLRYYLMESRWQLIGLMFICFSRALSEVGAVMIVGGNIRGETRTLTTSIALETSKGNTTEAIALGGTLLLFSVIIAIAISITQKR